MKKKIILPVKTAACFILTMLLAFSAQDTIAQSYMFDYMTVHQANSGDLVSHAIHKDDGNGVYYMLQSLPAERHSFVISEVDENYDILNSYQYTAVTGSPDGGYFPNENMNITPVDINFFSNQVIVVGNYIEEGVDRGAFMFSAEKSTGAFLWFQKYPDIATLESVVCNDEIDGAIAVGARGGSGFRFSITSGAGVIMRTDNTGKIIWQKDVEDDKYQGNQDGVVGTGNFLTHVIQIPETELYAAVGQVGGYLMNLMSYNDGDGTLIVFDQDGNSVSELGLGNTAPVTMAPGSQQNLQYQAALSVAPCSDGEVVIAGILLEFPETQFVYYCPGPTPTVAGIWVTKLNPYSRTISWSKIFDWWPTPYSPTSFPQFSNVDIINDGNDNFGIQSYSDIPAIMKLDINGNILYTRNYSNPIGGGGQFLDISTGMSSNAILTTGYLNAGLGWNVIAYDNLTMDYCNSDYLYLNEYNHEYDIFDIETQDYMVSPIPVHFIYQDFGITNTIDCEKIEAEGANKNSSGPGLTAAVSQDIVTGDVMVNIVSNEVYEGRLINSLGQSIKTYSNVQGFYRLNTSDIMPGIYFLHLESAKEKIVKPVLIR